MYEYTVAPFGLSSAPRLFTRVVAIIIAWLRSRGVRLYTGQGRTVRVLRTTAVSYVATEANHQLPTWFSRHPCPGATAVDAMSHAGQA